MKSEIRSSQSFAAQKLSVVPRRVRGRLTVCNSVSRIPVCTCVCYDSAGRPPPPLRRSGLPRAVISARAIPQRLEEKAKGALIHRLPTSSLATCRPLRSAKAQRAVRRVGRGVRSERTAGRTRKRRSVVVMAVTDAGGPRNGQGTRTTRTVQCPPWALFPHPPTSHRLPPPCALHRPVLSALFPHAFDLAPLSPAVCHTPYSASPGTLSRIPPPAPLSPPPGARASLFRHSTTHVNAGGIQPRSNPDLTSCIHSEIREDTYMNLRPVVTGRSARSLLVVERAACHRNFLESRERS